MHGLIQHSCKAAKVLVSAVRPGVKLLKARSSCILQVMVLWLKTFPESEKSVLAVSSSDVQDDGMRAQSGYFSQERLLG